jgi:hypothetical protein
MILNSLWFEPNTRYLGEIPLKAFWLGKNSLKQDRAEWTDEVNSPENKK